MHIEDTPSMGQNGRISERVVSNHVRCAVDIDSEEQNERLRCVRMPSQASTAASSPRAQTPPRTLTDRRPQSIQVRVRVQALWGRTAGECPPVFPLPERTPSQPGDRLVAHGRPAVGLALYFLSISRAKTRGRLLETEVGARGLSYEETAERIRRRGYPWALAPRT